MINPAHTTEFGAQRTLWLNDTADTTPTAAATEAGTATHTTTRLY
jgi:hypothetical protein